MLVWLLRKVSNYFNAVSSAANRLPMYAYKSAGDIPFRRLEQKKKGPATSFSPTAKQDRSRPP